jgi:hypothetical protein
VIVEGFCRLDGEGRYLEIVSKPVEGELGVSSNVDVCWCLRNSLKRSRSKTTKHETGHGDEVGRVSLVAQNPGLPA